MQALDSLKPGLIVIDGVDGAGKGEQTRRLFQAMKNNGMTVVLTREPGGSPGAEEIRRLIVEGEPGRWDAMTELLLIYAARRAHLRDTIWPAIERGEWVISDRFADSSRAFQGFAGQLGLGCVDRIHEEVVGAFEPLLTIILDIDPQTSLQRAQRRGGHEDRFEKKGLAFQQAVRDGYLTVARGSASHVVIDASGSINDVEARIRDALKAHLGMVFID